MELEFLSTNLIAMEGLAIKKTPTIKFTISGKNRSLRNAMLNIIVMIEIVFRTKIISHMSITHRQRSLYKNEVKQMKGILAFRLSVIIFDFRITIDIKIKIEINVVPQTAINRPWMCCVST